MTTAIPFDSVTLRFGLPLLFVGQAQKEAFVNEAHVLTDAIMHCAVEGVIAAPPPSPAEGECWLVSGDSSGAWAEHAGKIACHHTGNWLFIAPRDGMRVLDRSTGQDRRYFNAWLAPAAPTAPTGGTTVDTEARSVIAALIGALKGAGILAA